MNAAFLSFFLVFLIALGVRGEGEETCGLAKMKCKENQYCFRPSNLKLDIDIGVCLHYLRKGAVCTEDLLCSPELECKEVNSIIKFKTCQEPSDQTTEDEISTPDTTIIPDFTDNPPEESTFNPEPSDEPEEPETEESEER
ncbi:hypothetical protein HNY73_008653 [Argiope bruennichi]|uniref:Uncharacterized protein n=1 Tax=Argiope bruennichi TaxID=94029 RepID=A0A8T0F9X6_ARGBR|nr:hypothetical protein HNY73_008653 [Argiope bruennichi]